MWGSVRAAAELRRRPSLHTGALQVTLEEVYHSPVGSRDGTEGKNVRLWYGSEPVLEQWFRHLVEKVEYGEGGVVAIEDIAEDTLPAQST